MDSQIQPITRSEALRSGITDKQLWGPKFQRLFQGIYLPAGEAVCILQRARAALMIAPDGSYASHHTAALLWGAAPPDTIDTHICVPRSGSSRSVRKGIVAHRADPDQQPVRHRGLLVATPAAVFLQMAAVAPDLVELVVLGDSLVRTGRVTPDELVDAADGWDGKGARRARRAAHLVRSGVDSPMESRLRMLIVLAGFPEPTVNVILRHENGEWDIRLDLSYPHLKLVIEYDGRHHVLRRTQWSRDIMRREWLESQGWRIVVTWLPSRPPAAWTRQFLKPSR